MIGCLDQIGLYGYLLKGMEIPDPLRNDLQGGFHKFAFEYWLLCRTKSAVASPWRRYQLRQLLHREARNERYFKDPASIQAFFSDGKFVPSVVVSPVTGLELLGLSETNYAELVKGFQVTFFDATNIFPVNPIPGASEIAGSQAEEQLQLAHAMGGKAWPLMPRDKLSARYQNDPYAAFQLLSVTGQAYYMPDFLFMCERDSDRVGNLPKKLLDKLCADTPRSVEFRSRFNEAQKKCIVRFFEDWFDGRDAYWLKRLRKKMGMQLNK